MASSKKIILWDFDGTLAYRTSDLPTEDDLKVIRQQCPQIDLSRERFAPLLPPSWGKLPQYFGSQLSDLWWANAKPIPVEVFQSLGFSTEEATELARFMRYRYDDVNRWRLFDDTIPVLKSLREQGWIQVIVTNCVPGSVVDGLGLIPLVDRLVNSSVAGYAKPEPKIYHLALVGLGEMDNVWMAGDSVVNDVLVPRSLGINGVLVRATDPRAPLQFPNLHDFQSYLDHDEATRPKSVLTAPS